MVLTALGLWPQLLLAATAKESLGNATPAAIKNFGSVEMLLGAIISALLAFLGVIFLILIFYAGFLWMIDAGSGEKIKKAKSIMLAAVIGLILTLAAYAITLEIMTILQNASSSGQIETNGTTQ